MTEIDREVFRRGLIQRNREMASALQEKDPSIKSPCVARMLSWLRMVEERCANPQAEGEA